MFSSHAKKRAQQRGVKLHMCRLLRWYGDLVDAGNGTVLRYFSKQAKGRLSALFGARFLAVNHEKLRAFLIEERASGAVVTVGKLYPNRRLRRSKVKRGAYRAPKNPPQPSRCRSDLQTGGPIHE